MENRRFPPSALQLIEKARGFARPSTTCPAALKITKNSTPVPIDFPVWSGLIVSGLSCESFSLVCFPLFPVSSFRQLEPSPFFYLSPFFHSTRFSQLARGTERCEPSAIEAQISGAILELTATDSIYAEASWIRACVQRHFRTTCYSTSALSVQEVSANQSNQRGLTLRQAR